MLLLMTGPQDSNQPVSLAGFLTLNKFDILNVSHITGPQDKNQPVPYAGFFMKRRKYQILKELVPSHPPVKVWTAVRWPTQ